MNLRERRTVSGVLGGLLLLLLIVILGFSFSPGSIVAGNEPQVDMAFDYGDKSDDLTRIEDDRLVHVQRFQDHFAVSEARYRDWKGWENASFSLHNEFDSFVSTNEEVCNKALNGHYSSSSGTCSFDFSYIVRNYELHRNEDGLVASWEFRGDSVIPYDKTGSTDNLTLWVSYDSFSRQEKLHWMWKADKESVPYAAITRTDRGHVTAEIDAGHFRFAWDLDQDKDGFYDPNDACETKGDQGNGLRDNGCPVESSEEDSGSDTGESPSNDGGGNEPSQDGGGGIVGMISKLVDGLVRILTFKG